MIEEGIFKYILQSEPLQALLPTVGGLYMDFIPESAPYPVLMFETISSVSDTTFDGPSGLVTRRFQFTAAAKDAINNPGSGAVVAKRLADTLRQQIDGLNGTLPDGTLLFNCWIDNEMSSYDSDANIFHMIQDYYVQFRRDP